MIRMKLSFFMPLKSLTIVIFFILSASSLLCGAEPSSENEERIRAYFKRFPQSDANNDGILTYSELMIHLKEMRKARSQNKDEDKDEDKDDDKGEGEDQDDEMRRQGDGETGRRRDDETRR